MPHFSHGSHRVARIAATSMRTFPSISIGEEPLAHAPNISGPF
jgi:hypothetical protein